ncbi:sperm-specific protein PHI-2B/PHI-3 isoform X2 [Cherax quadricarinatus]|uniref:sperm-specific protein PHI-2B/PHI-3 isoform X2 n=1 Tax=Cherax quadricarinatus TaxID=27406 RepID=UPI00387EE80E
MGVGQLAWEAASIQALLLRPHSRGRQRSAGFGAHSRSALLAIIYTFVLRTLILNLFPTTFNIKPKKMSDEENRADEAQDDEDTKDDVVDETSEAEADDAKDEANEPPKKRSRKAASSSKAKEGKKAGAKKKKRTVKKHPKTMDMIIEAIENLGERKGSSVQAIKAYILQNFKTVRPDMIKSMLRRSLTAGLDQGTVARPKGQTDTQVMSGRYLLGKTAKKEDEDEVMPQQSKRAQEAKKSAKKSKKKGSKKSSKKVAKRPVAKTASTPPTKRPVKKTKARK